MRSSYCSSKEKPVELQTQLESIRHTLQRKGNIITTLDEEISNLLDEQGIEKDIVDRSECEHELEDTLCRIERALRNQTGSQPSQQSVHSQQLFDKVKLPKLPVLTFNGDPTEWTPFWESFESIIDKNANHGDIDKCKYLQRSLTGDVAQTITGLPISSENYKETMELLRNVLTIGRVLFRVT